MRITTIKIGLTKSRNYQSYTSEEVIEIQTGDDIDTIKEVAFAKCREDVQKQINIDTGKK